MEIILSAAATSQGAIVLWRHTHQEKYMPLVFPEIALYPYEGAPQESEVTVVHKLPWSNIFPFISPSEDFHVFLTNDTCAFYQQAIEKYIPQVVVTRLDDFREEAKKISAARHEFRKELKSRESIRKKNVPTLPKQPFYFAARPDTKSKQITPTIKTLHHSRLMQQEIEQIKSHFDTEDVSTEQSSSSQKKSILLYTDASQSLDNEGWAVSGWVNADPHRPFKKTRDPEFGISIQRFYDIDNMEALAILLAIVENPGYDNYTIKSDSQNGIKIARNEINRVMNSGHYGNKFFRPIVSPRELQKILADASIKIEWVKAHNGDVWNEGIDKIVVIGRHKAGEDIFLMQADELKSKLTEEWHKYVKWKKM